MALQETQQILEAMKRSKKPLLCVPAGGGPDAYAAAIGLARVLTKLDKVPEIVAADGPAPQTLRFLVGHESILGTLENLRRFVIELDATKTKVQELSYEMKDDRLLVSLCPKTGCWNPNDVRVSTSAYKYDLVICIGASDLESCASLFRENPDFFFSTPIINIDHAPGNEHYGAINVVDLTATSCGEVCHDLVEAIEPGLMDEESATAFLTGMIAKTKSFKTANVTPKTLTTAGKLIAKGARREAAVHHLYRTRSVHTLRLWGRALARLKADEGSSLVWTMLSQQDFMHAGAEEQDLPDVIDELIASSPQAKLVVLLYENRERHVCGIIRAERPLDALALAAPFSPTGTHETVRVCFIGKTIIQIEKEVIERLKETLKKI